MANSKLINIIDYQDKVLWNELIAILDERENSLRNELALALKTATKEQQAAIREVLEPLIGKVEAALQNTKLQNRTDAIDVESRPER